MGVVMDITYEGNLNCTATHGPSGMCLRTDAPVDNGGKVGIIQDIKKHARPLHRFTPGNYQE